MLAKNVIIVHQRNAEIMKLQEAKVKSFSTEKQRKQFQKIEQADENSIDAGVINGPSGPDTEGNDYLEQYNANQDFAIFAHKN